MRKLGGITNLMNMSEQTRGESEGQGTLGYWSSLGRRVAHDLVTEQQHLLQVCLGVGLHQLLREFIIIIIIREMQIKTSLWFRFAFL